MVEETGSDKFKNNSEVRNYDIITGLPLRRTFWDIADRVLMQDERTYCMLAIDVENFHFINKWFGRNTGDELLVLIGEYLKRADSQWKTISGYIGGDNFCVVFPENDELLERIQKDLSEIVFRFKGSGSFRTIFSAYKTKDKNITAGDMCDYTNIALHAIKNRPDVTFCWYSPEMESELEEESELMPLICEGMENDEFTFYLQPKCEIQSGKVVGAEALVRWTSKKRGKVSPGVFIPVLEKNGYINQLDKYIWEKVCQTIRKWMNQGRTILPVSVNVSRADIYSMDVVRIFKDLISQYNIPPYAVEIEITESAYVENGTIIKETEEAFKEAGFRILIDDFGSGYSSLNMLKDVDADVLKLDMKFLDLTPKNNEKGVSIITAVLDMARELDIPTIAEGLENEEQLKLLDMLGCEYAQGYYFYKPMPISEYEKLLDDSSKCMDMSGISRRRRNDTSYLQEIKEYFWKLADVNVITGDYHFIRRVNEPEYIVKPRPSTISEYADRYIANRIIHPDDAHIYRDAINLERIRNQVKNGRSRERHQIRYLVDGRYKWYTFEITKPETYSEDNPRVLFSWKEADYMAGSRQDTLDIVYNTFLKVLKLNLNDATYEVIKPLDKDEINGLQLPDNIKNYSEFYINRGVIHPEDINGYLTFIARDAVRKHFDDSSEPLRLKFRRRIGEEYKWVELVLARSRDYTQQTPIIMFYLREVRYIYDETIVAEEENEERAFANDIWEASEYYFDINISGNSVSRNSGIIEWETETGAKSASFDDSVAYLTDNFIMPEYKKIYKEFMNRDRIKSQFAAGNQLQTLDYRRMFKGTPTWMRILMFVYKDKGTGDVCAKEIVMNIDEAKRLELELWIKNTRK